MKPLPPTAQACLEKRLARHKHKQDVLRIYMQSKIPVMYTEISEKLNIPLELVGELSEELEKEGYLE